MTEPALRNGLINAGFSYEDHERRVSVLSGGERARLMFLRLKLDRPNFLIKDEPTNHIDLDGREQLEEQLSESGATLLITSHDRRFLDNLANRFLLVADGRLTEIPDPEAFYEASLAERDAGGAPGSSVLDVSAGDAEAAGEDELLERIVALEQKLTDDLARKPRFQKPARQAEWLREIEALNRRLDGDG